MHCHADARYGLPVSQSEVSSATLDIMQVQVNILTADADLVCEVATRQNN